ncbi:MAG: FG-GAP-like repeat-containing protein [Pseudoruegeria sp.]
MQRFLVQGHLKRFVLSLLLILTIAVLFWTQSRYPALDEKALMSGAIQLEDPLGFEAKFPLNDAMSTVERIFYSTLNWINTNKKGMTFGILFAAAFLTALPYVKQRSFQGGFSNSVLGLIIGTPLGVCVNCAAPIARGMYAGGLRAETTLSAMIASPTLNIVVLTMTFSLLPAYMAIGKIALSLGLILLVVPLICRLLPPEQLNAAPEAQINVPAPTDWDMGTPKPEGLFTALMAVAIGFAKNLWYIVKMTVPLMLLAGFLGATVATLLPEEMLLNLNWNFGFLVIVALVGVFLPVPIAFDVVVTGALLSAGLDPGYVMALLFTLGSFSVYSFFIVTQAISLRAGLMLSAAVVVAGVLAGAAAQTYHDRQSDRALELLLGQASPMLWGAAQASEVPEGVTVAATPHAPRSPAADAPFSRLEASEIGIDKPLEFGFRDMWPPFWEGRSLSSGDIDRDGDLDLVVASTEVGLYLYENDGQGQFTRIPVDLGLLAELPLFNAALVDLNNDGLLDLFLTSYRQGNYRWLNSGHGFDQSQPPVLVPNRPEAVLSLALSFADIDRDSNLDVALGNWAAGWYRRIPGEESRNRILINDGSLTNPSAIDLPGIPGETLSILLSDINADGRADLLVGNDFEIPDMVYLSTPEDGLRLISAADGLIPHTTNTTMAVKTADLSNRGSTDLYFAQIAGRSSGVSDILKMQPLEQYCDAIKDPDALATCQVNMEIKSWYKSGNNFNPSYASKCQELSEPAQGQCKAMLIKDLAIQKEDPKVCALIPAAQPYAKSFCELHFLPFRAPTQAQMNAALPQIKRSNVLLSRPEADTPFADIADARGLAVGGWSWDTKIADFDNDGWQDVYIVNGTWVPNEVSPSNLFFHNDGTGHFTEDSGQMGLEDYLMTAAATVFDLDGDGDLDVVTHPVNGPMVVFRNNDQQGNAISFTLADKLGNHDGIGAVLRLKAGGITQQRELQLGGGFMSFDAPVVHFGLGEIADIDSLTIHWTDGTITTLTDGLKAGYHHHISRS